jgi:AsmA protein
MAAKKDNKKSTPVQEGQKMNALKSAVLGLVGIFGVAVSFVGIKVPFAESLAKDHWRAGTAALLLVILLIPAAVGVLLFMVDANQFKAEIVQFVKVQTQRDLVLQGDIKVKFFPKLGLETGKMSLSQRNSAREFASINNARLYVAWWPLLKKQLVFDRVEIDGLSANLIRLADGATNYDDLLIRDENLAPMTFDIDSVHISHSALNWQDDVRWQRISLKDLQLETGRLADAVPGHMSASFHIESERARSNGKVELQSSLFYESKTGRYEFADIEGKLEGDTAWFNNVTLGFKGNVEAYPAIGTMTVEHASVTVSGKLGQRAIEAHLATPRLQYIQHKLSGGSLSVEATSTLPDATLKTSMQMPEFTALDGLFNSPNTNATFDLKGEGHTLQGKLASSVTLNFQSAPKVQFDYIVLSLIGRHPALASELAASITGNAQADFEAQHAKLDFIAKFDDSQISGTAGLQNFSRPAYTFEIYANRLDFDRYVATDWIRLWRDDATAFSVGGLRNLNLNGSLQAGEIRLGHRRASKFATGIKVDQATLTIAPLVAQLFGGAMSGSISIAAQDVPRVEIRQSLRGFKADGMFVDAAGNDRLTGQGDFVLDVALEGANVGALRKSLSGTATLALARGALAGIDLRAALLAGRGDLGTRSTERASAARFTDKTAFTSLKTAFNIMDGSSSANSFEIKSPLIAATGDGDLALDGSNLAYRLNVTVASRLNRSTAGDLAELKGITVPMRVSGNYAAPSFALDFAAASGGNVAQLSAAFAARQAALAAPPAAVAKHGVKPGVKPGDKQTHKKKVP